MADNDLMKNYTKKRLDKYFKLPVIKKFSPIVKHFGAMGGSGNVNQNGMMMGRAGQTLQSMGFSPIIDRLQRYAEYAVMDYTSELQAGLDIFSDDCTTKFIDGDVIHINTEDRQIKEELEQLYFNVLNLNFNLWGWVRDTLKFGDNFVLMDLGLGQGVCGVLPLSVYEVERVEDIMDKDNPIKFIINNQVDREFSIWEIAHFRMFGDKDFYPYGKCLKHDTIIKTKDGVKYIKDIVKGDVVEAFDVETQTFVDSKVLDTVYSGKKKLYKFYTKNNFLEVSSEHNILVYDNGKFIDKSADSIKLGDVLVLKQYNSESGQDILINKNFQTDTNKNGWKNTLNIIPDYVDEDFAKLFGFLLGDGWVCNDNSVFMAYSDSDILNNKYISLLQKFTGKVGNVNLRNDKSEINNIAFGSKMFVNILRNMGFINGFDKKDIPNWIFNAKKNIKEAFIEGLVDADGSMFIDEWNCVRYSIELANKNIIYKLKYLLQTLNRKSGKISSRKRLTKFIDGNELINEPKESFYFYFYDSEIIQIKKWENKDRLSDEYILDYVKKIEYDDDIEEDVYDIYIEHNNHYFNANSVVVHNSILEPVRRYWRQLTMLEDAMLIYRIVRSPERRVIYVDVGGLQPDAVEAYVNEVATTLKNMPIDVDNTGNLDYRLNPMSMMDDYVIPVRGKDSGTKIDTLKGSTHLTDMADIKYIQRKLVTSLKVPLRYLGLDDESKSDLKNAAAQEDIRFSRTIERIQGMIISELKKIGIIHLILRGYPDELVDGFELQMKNPSSASEVEKLEVIKEKFGIAADILEGKLAGREWVYQNILNFTVDEIGIINTQLEEDYKFMSRLNAFSATWVKKYQQDAEKEYNIQKPQDALAAGMGGAGEEENPEDVDVAGDFRSKSIGGDNNVGNRLLTKPVSSTILRPYESKSSKFKDISNTNLRILTESVKRKKNGEDGIVTNAGELLQSLMYRNNAIVDEVKQFIDDENIE